MGSDNDFASASKVGGRTETPLAPSKHPDKWFAFVLDGARVGWSTEHRVSAVSGPKAVPGPAVSKQFLKQVFTPFLNSFLVSFGTTTIIRYRVLLTIFASCVI